MPRLALAFTVAALLIVPGSAQGFVYKEFRTPSGNIGCGYNDHPHHLRCDIRESSDLPPEPRSCELDYGNAYSMNLRGRAQAICAGDTANNPESPVLHYGHTKHIGGFTCKSKRIGLRCHNKSHHGFFLSRARIDVF
jgi:hypothetical protein